MPANDNGRDSFLKVSKKRTKEAIHQKKGGVVIPTFRRNIEKIVGNK